jgi:hypothetical protein
MRLRNQQKGKQERESWGFGIDQQCGRRSVLLSVGRSLAQCANSSLDWSVSVSMLIHYYDQTCRSLVWFWRKRRNAAHGICLGKGCRNVPCCLCPLAVMMQKKDDIWCPHLTCICSPLERASMRDLPWLSLGLPRTVPFRLKQKVGAQRRKLSLYNWAK